MAVYNETVMEHFMNPHNVGEIENAIEKDNNIIQSIVVKRKLNNNRRL